MKSFKSFPVWQEVFVAFCLLYIALTQETPPFVAAILDNMFGFMLMLALIGASFAFCHPLLGILTMITIYFIYRRIPNSAVFTGAGSLFGNVGGDDDMSSVSSSAAVDSASAAGPKPKRDRGVISSDTLQNNPDFTQALEPDVIVNYFGFFG